jgi:hypothetical protein
MPDWRILALDGAAGSGWPVAGPGWHLVGAGADPASARADALLIGGGAAADDALIDRLALPLIVAVAGDMSALIDRADAWLLPGDDAAVIGDVVARLMAGPAGVAEATETTQQISALSAEARRIADALAELAAAAEAQEPAPISAAMVRKLIRLRRDRDRHFPAELFADPAWDMLLDLAAARMEGADVPVSSLCLAAAVPTTTALRWIRTLSQAGLLVRRTDTADARRSFIGLSDQAFDGVAGWLRRFAGVFQPR